MATAKKLPSGNWRVNLFIGCDENKKRQFKSFTAETKKEAEYLAAEYKMFKKDNLQPKNMTVEEALQEYINIKSNILSPSTIHGYEIIKKHRMKGLQSCKLSDLKQEIIQREINIEAAKVSRKTLANTYGLLSSVLRMYYPEFHYNVTLPAKKKHISELLTPDTILKVAQGSNVELPVVLALWLGLRLSEIKGLKYKDISNGYLTIQRTMLKVGKDYVVRENTKTYNSTRILKLPEYILNLIGIGNKNDFIVTISHSTIYSRFSQLLKKNNLKHIRFHDLRHLNASVMLQLGIPDKYAMERGGWATNQILKNVYQHTFVSERQNIDNKIDAYFNNIQHEIQHDNNNAS